MSNSGTAKLIVLSAPSGSGKTTIARAILERHKDFIFSVSATTRPKRINETHGKDYFFISREEFQQKINENAFIEHENIYNDFYGSLKSQVKDAFSKNTSIIFDIDVKGALSIKYVYPRESILIFIAPPDIETLTHRLRTRNTEPEEKLQTRLARVPMEMEKRHDFDYIVQNDDLQRAIQEVDSIIINSINN